jgi:hypothetical protein
MNPEFPPGWDEGRVERVIEHSEKRTVTAPVGSRLNTGEVLSVELAADEVVQWIWSHHGERGSSVIGYTILPSEPGEVPRERNRPIGFFELDEKKL